MSKILKLIDGLILAAFIVIGLALMVPKAFGYTVTVSDENQVGNIPVGTTVYSRQIAGSGLVPEDKIVVQSGDSLNILTIEAVNTAAQTIDVSGNINGEVITYNIPTAAQKVVRSVPLIGYLLLCVKTTKGLIMLAALLAAVIVLFIVSEIIRGGDDEYEDETDEDYEEEDDDDFYRRLAEQKRARDNHQQVSDELAMPAEVVPARKARGFREEGAEAENEGNGMKELFREETAAEAKAADASMMQNAPVDNLDLDELPDVQAALEAALESQPLNRREEAPAPLPEPQVEEEVVVNEDGEIELAMPVYTADELLQKAYAEGLDPTIDNDPATGITLVNYSDCL